MGKYGDIIHFSYMPLEYVTGPFQLEILRNFPDEVPSLGLYLIYNK